MTGWSVYEACGERREEVAVIDTRTGTRRTLLTAPDADFSSPRISPDGRSVLAIRSGHDTVTEPGDVTLVLVPLDGSADPADLLAGLDRWPAETAWAADSGSVFFTADDHGRRPVFRAELGAAQPGPATLTQLTTDDGAYTSLCPAPDGRSVYALRAAVDSPPAAVRLDASQPGEPDLLAGPAGPPRPARPADRDRDHSQRRGGAAGLAGAARGGRRGLARAAAAVGARRPAVELEHLVLAVEPVADGGPRLRGAAARPGPVHRVRAGLHRPRPRRVGRPAVHRPDGDHRRGGGPAGHRRDSHRHDGRLVRRLHGQLDRRAHRPVPGHRQPRQPVGAGPDVRHHRLARAAGGGCSATPQSQPERYSANSPHLHAARSAPRC